MLANIEYRWCALRTLVAAAACALALASPAPASASPLNLPHTVGAVTVTILSHPAAVTRLQAATFGWSTTGIVGETRCKMDSQAYTYCPSHPAHYRGMADGHHTFTIRIRNGYNVTATASFSWLVDTAPPGDPAVSGGSLSWRSPASASVTAGGSSDALSGLAGYQWRSSTDGSAWSSASAGAVATIRAQGETYVQFRSVDKAGNTSPWQPAANGAGNLVRLDHAPPTTPTVVGGSPIWQGVASETVTGSGATDARSGVDHYEYRVSTDNGISYGAVVTGTSIQFTATGSYVVQFRAVDGVGLASPWGPSSPGAASSACIL